MWEAIDRLTGLNTNFQGRRLSKIGKPIQPNDVVSKIYVDTQAQILANLLAAGGSGGGIPAPDNERMRIDEFSRLPNGPGLSAAERARINTVGFTKH